MPYTNTRTKNGDALIPLTNEHRYQVGHRLEICEADSADGRWHFAHDETMPRGTRWRAEYRPTRQEMYFASLYGARQWAGNPLSLNTFRDTARRVIHAGGHTPGLGPQTAGTESVRRARLNQAHCQLAILDGLMVTAGDRRRPCAACACGGLLTTNGPSAWLHIDACVECWGDRACRDLDQHRVCGDPNPVICDHPMCVAPQDLNTHPCAAGHPVCCGCCHGED